MITNNDIFDYLKNNKSIKYKLSINDLYEQNICNEDTKQEFKKSLHNLILESKNNKKNPDNNISDIDNKLSTILNNQNYYIYKCDNKDSFLESILYITDKNFCYSSEKGKHQLITDFRNKIYFDTEKKLEIFKNKLCKSQIQENLISNKDINNDTKIYIGELLDINIIILYDIEEYHILNSFKDNRKSILLFYNKGFYSPLLHQNNFHYIDNNIVSKIQNLYKQKYKQNKTEKIKDIKKMKMPELYKIC